MNVLSKCLSKCFECGQKSSISLLSSFMDLPNETLAHIFEFCGLETIKMLRGLKNCRILAVTRTCKTKHFKHWSFPEITAKRLCLFLQQVVILKGITIDRLHGNPSEADGVLEALVGERPELESVGILRSECSDKSLQLLLQHPRIKIVKLPRSNVTGDIQLLSSLAVEELNLAYCWYMTDTGLITFLSKTRGNLRILDLQGTNVSFSGINSQTFSLPLLEKLNLSYCSNMTDTGLITFLNKTGGNLRIIDLQGTNVSFSDIDSLTASFSQLEELKLMCSNMTDTGLIAFLNKTGGNLRILNLGGRNVSFSGIDSLATSFYLLEKLNLAGCRNMTDTGLITFLNKTGGNLRILDLSGTNISFSETDSLATSFSKLEQLDLSNCCNVTEAGLIAFLRSTTGDFTIFLGGMSDFAAFDEEKVKSSYPNLDVHLW